MSGSMSGDFLTPGPSLGGAGLLSTLSKEDLIPREPPEDETESRKALVISWCDKVKGAKGYWKRNFDRMRDDQDFAFGKQWSKDDKDRRYVANLTLRSIQQRTAFLYAKNPKFLSRRRERILSTVWDGEQASLMQAQQQAAQLMQGAQAGLIDPAMAMQQGMPLMAIMQDAARVKEQSQQLEKIAKTLEVLFSWNIAEQAHPFKAMMKLVVRRTCTTGVGYVKLGFQRLMERRPEIEARLADAAERLATLERLASDIADEVVTDDNSKEIEELRLQIADLQNQVQFVVREGLFFDYPLSTSIIPDTNIIHLREFLGAEWVAQEFLLSVDDIKEIYEVDVSKNYNAYSSETSNALRVSPDGSYRRGSGRVPDYPRRDRGLVWEVYSKKDNLVYVVCDGYPEFLREPASPETRVSRFYPWFSLMFNEIDHESEIFPPSDVKIIQDMQMEFNRARQGLREHRRAMRPKTVVAAGMLDDEDLAKLESHPANAILELNGLQPGQKVEDLLQAYTGPKIDPNLYDVEPLYQDILRTTGIQEANLGGTSRTTATQTQVAEASRMTSMGSNIDDIDDLMTQLGKAGAEILLQEIAVDTVKRIVGEGAVWPELTRQQVVEEVWLECEAGSTGRPNQAQDIANAERMYPLLMQLPGINPEWMAKDLIRRLDDRADLTNAFLPTAPSIIAMNAAAKGIGGGGAPPGQGGADNSARTSRGNGDTAPDQVRSQTGQAPPPRLALPGRQQAGAPPPG